MGSNSDDLKRRKNLEWEKLPDDVQKAYSSALDQGSYLRLSKKRLAMAELWMSVKYNNSKSRKGVWRFTNILFSTWVEGYRLVLDTPVLRGLFPARRKYFKTFRETIEHLTKCYLGKEDDLSKNEEKNTFSPEELGYGFHFLKISGLGPSSAVDASTVAAAMRDFTTPSGRSRNYRPFTVEPGDEEGIFISRFYLPRIKPGGLGAKIVPHLYLKRIDNEDLWTWTCHCAQGSLGVKGTIVKAKTFDALYDHLEDEYKERNYLDKVVKQLEKAADAEASDGSSSEDETTAGAGWNPAESAWYGNPGSSRWGIPPAEFPPSGGDLQFPEL